MNDLTILCVTQGELHAEPFIRQMAGDAHAIGAPFVLVIDGPKERHWLDHTDSVRFVQSEGYIESVLDQAITACPEGYILRLDDDESIPADTFEWLKACEYRQADHWAFPRHHLWPDCEHYIENAPLWPDLQTRLSVKAKAGGRRAIHAGSPHGTGRVAPVAIEHHKFLVRSREEREAIAAKYERLQSGSGSGHYRAFSVPEEFEDLLVCQPVRAQVAA